MKFEIGQKVKWYIGKMYLCGLYLDEIDEQFSEVKIYERSGKRYIQTVKVLTELLELIPE